MGCTGSLVTERQGNVLKAYHSYILNLRRN